MSAAILKPGLQTTLQGRPRLGYRHMGMPYSGPADGLSAALANHLVGNAPGDTVLEITYGGLALTFDEPAWFALTGAPAAASLNGAPIQHHQTQHAPAGSSLQIDMAPHGTRLYLAIAGGWIGETVLGSPSTYLPAGLGGHHGRALNAGDTLAIPPQPSTLPILTTPPDLRPHITESCLLRAYPSAEFTHLRAASQAALFDQAFHAGAQIDRMGTTLEGPPLVITTDGKMKSAAVFPGTVQCPKNGQPIILLPDAQTTGGYPRIAHIARCDQHLLGQIRPGSKVQLLRRSAEAALKDYDEKSALIGKWLPNYQL